MDLGGKTVFRLRLIKILKILSSNWIHLIGFYLTTYLSIILFKLIGLPNSINESWISVLWLSILTIPLLFYVYGLKIIGGFYAAVLIFDLLAFNIFRNKTKLILFIEWLIIVPVFINWAIEYEYWFWITLSVSFLVTQYLRSKKIDKIILDKDKSLPTLQKNTFIHPNF